MRMPGDDLSVSVIIPSHDRCDRLARLLATLDRPSATGGSFEVIVAVDGSTDGTLEMLESLRTGYPLRVVAQPCRGPAAARNAAIAVARGDVLLFLDDDVTPVDRLIERHLAVHRLSERAAVIGRMAAPPGVQLPPWLEWEAALLDRQYAWMLRGAYPTDWRAFYTANASVRRAEVVAVGAFDERLLRQEDIELARRLAERGVGFHFIPDAVVHHHPDRTFEGWLRAASERGRQDVRLEREGGAHEQSLTAEWRRRHLLNRALARWCVGHPLRTRAVVAALRRALSLARGAARARRLICSALFNVQYWSGVAEAMRSTAS